MLVSSFLDLLSIGRKSRSRRKAFSRTSSQVSAEVLEHRQLLTAQITQIGDFNLVADGGSSDPQELTQVGTTLFFTAADKTHGRELWKKEGSNAAVLVKDVFPGTETSAVRNLTAVGTTLFFTADDGIHGTELWKSDGTTAGTILVKDTLDTANDSNSFNVGSGPFDFHAVNGTLFYRGNPEWGNPNPTLMISDGTEAGTHKVTDSYLDTPFSWARSTSSAQLGSLFLFDAYGLYVTDGTSAGTTRLVGEYGDMPFELTTVGSVTFFTREDATNGRELWKTDGTVAGTVLVSNINPGTHSNPSFLTNVNGTLYFSADDGSTGRELWKSDGTAAGTVRVFDVAGASLNPQQFTAVGSTVFFRGLDPATGRDRLWKTDGTSAGTVMLGSSVTDPESLIAVGSTLYFTSADNATGRELWKSDGTVAGTTLYKDLVAGSDGSIPALLKNINGFLYYAAYDAVKGRELWRHDLTSNTAVINDIYRGTRSSDTHDFVTAGNNLFFVVTYRRDNGSIERHELWKSALNGTGATLLRTSLPDDNWGFQNMTNFKGSLYFIMNEDSVGVELWKSDGTVAGTVRVKDINQTVNNSSHSAPSSLTVVNDTLFFSADDGSTGRELWKSDGTTAGTVLVKDITTGFLTDSIAYQSPMVAAGSNLYFFADNGATGSELWKSDGTAAGTTLVKDIWTGPTSSNPGQMITIGDLIYFVANDGINGRELWQSDGTAAGTSMVVDLTHVDIFGDTAFRSITNANGKLYFEYALQAFGTPSGYKLACRPTPTSPLTIINPPGELGGTPLTAIGNSVYFNAPDSTHGNELWKSDGTQAGTILVKDLFNIPRSSVNGQMWSSDPQQIVASNGMLYFSAYTPSNGRELWMSDGTTGGTVLLADMTGDPGSSSPESLTAINGRVFLTAVTEATGREPFTVIDVFTPTAPTITAPATITPTQRPTITWTASTGAVSYDVFIKNNATGANPQVSVNVVGTTSYVPAADLGIGKFTVWVRAVSASGTKSAWSAQKDFTVNTSATTAVMIRNQSTSRPKVNWNDLAGAVKYDVWLDSTTAGQTSSVILHDIRGKSWQSTTDLALGSYRVWVRGLDASGLAAAWSPVVYFNVATSPTMTAPLSSTFERRPQFAWNAV
ncbi:MAG: hypothetical protein JNM43_18000, partial [Planctomycetaceae bacterium]|nr:hypothetical protein [Planctomycetaceae bacterium]